MINDAIDYIPTAYKKLKTKWKTKCKSSAYYVVNKGIGLIHERFN